MIHIVAKSLGPLRGPILPWFHMRNLGPLSKMKKGQRSWGQVLVRNSRKKARRRNTKLITFAPVIALVTLKIVSLQLNGMLMMWKIQQAMQDDAIQVAIIHQGNRAEISHMSPRQNSSRLLSQLSQLGSCEEALMRTRLMPYNSVTNGCVKAARLFDNKTAWLLGREL